MYLPILRLASQAVIACWTAMSELPQYTWIPHPDAAFIASSAPYTAPYYTWIPTYLGASFLVYSALYTVYAPRMHGSYHTRMLLSSPLPHLTQSTCLIHVDPTVLGCCFHHLFCTLLSASYMWIPTYLGATFLAYSTHSAVREPHTCGSQRT